MKAYGQRFFDGGWRKACVGDPRIGAAVEDAQCYVWCLELF
jgi:hypothetical protein